MDRRRRQVLFDALLAVAAALTVAVVGAAVWFGQQNVDVAASSLQPGQLREDSGAPRTPGSYLRTRIDTDGRVASDQYIVTDQAVQTLTLRLRPLTGYDDVNPVVSQLHVVADGREIDVDPGQLSGTGAKGIALGSPSTVIHLRYVTDGGVIRSTPSSSGRALVLANPLVARVDAPVQRDVIRLDGPQVLSLSCGLGGQLPQPCGRPAHRGWRVLLEPAEADSVVLGQVDLPDV